MGFDADWALAGAMRGGMRGSGFPRGHMSGKKPCPVCGKGVAGRHDGMTSHLRTKHKIERKKAMAMGKEAWAGDAG